MDSIDLIDPSYGERTDGTGSLVSNQIKLKGVSRSNIEKRVANAFNHMAPAEVEEAVGEVKEKIEEVKDEIQENLASASIEDMDANFVKMLKEKSEYAKTLEKRVEALEAKDVEMFVATFKLEKSKPIKIKPTNFVNASKHGREFSTFVEVPQKEEVQSFDKDITMDTFEPQIQNPEDIDVEQVALDSQEQLAKDVNDAMGEADVNEPEGFVPEASEIPEVDVEVASRSENVEDIPDKELSEDFIRDEIEMYRNQLEPEQNSMADVNLAGLTEEPKAVAEEKEETVESVVPEEVEEELEDIVEPGEELETEEEVEEIEEPIREMPEVAFDREAVIPVELEEKEAEQKNEEVEPVQEELEEKEELTFDYSEITDADVEKTDSIKMLEEMKKARQAKLQAMKEAEEKANQEEKELTMSSEEVEAIRRRAAESDKSVQEKLAAVKKRIESYDAAIEKANKRREKAAEGRAKNAKEIADYEASIASNESIEKELDLMMEAEEEETQKRR